MSVSLWIGCLCVALLAIVGSAVAPLAQSQKPLVVGGEDALHGDLPFQVALAAQPSSPRVKCGGVLIKSKWVLTAGHCVHAHGAKESLLVKAGSLYTTESSQIQRIREIYFPPGFRPNPSFPAEDNVFFNDLALLELASEFRLDGGGTGAATLVTPEEEGSLLSSAQVRKYVAGWGAIDGNGYSTRLKKAVVLPVARVTCQGRYGSTNVTESMLCAGTESANSCLGDSGGPYVAHLRERAKLLGIISWGEICTGSPSVHTRLVPYLAWIKEISGRNG